MSWRNPFNRETPTQSSSLGERTVSIDEKAQAVQTIKDFVWYDGVHTYVPLDKLMTAAERLIRAGAISLSEVQAMPEVRQAAIRSLLSTLGGVSGHYSDVKEFVEERDEWVTAGFFTTEEVNQLPAVRAAAVRDLHSVAGGHPESIQETKDSWLSVGILTSEEMDELIEGEQRRIRARESS